MTGQTNAGGGGRLSDRDALLLVRVPRGFSATAQKSGLMLSPTLWQIGASSNEDVALFVVTPAQFDASTPWTVTATDGAVSKTASVLIAAVDAYEIDLTPVMLFDHGNLCDAITGGWTAVGKSGGAQGWPAEAPTVTQAADYYSIYFPASKGAIYCTVDTIDLTPYSALKATLRHDAAFAAGVFAIAAFDASQLNMNGLTNAAAKTPLQDTTVGQDMTLAVDLTSVTGLWQIGFAHYKSVADTIDRLWSVWLEE